MSKFNKPETYGNSETTLRPMEIAPRAIPYGMGCLRQIKLCLIKQLYWIFRKLDVSEKN
jgi:hypothetical protein